MKFNHRPIFNTEEAIRHYSKKDDVEIIYVCSTELTTNATADVFYREEPHPTFGNRYFGLYYNNYQKSMMICNADIIETLGFDMLKHEDTFYYSNNRHDYITLGDSNESFIDGGRAYCRCGGIIIPAVYRFKVKNGEFVLLQEE